MFVARELIAQKFEARLAEMVRRYGLRKQVGHEGARVL